jgi:site-specific DNA-methyltransferase (adenine-specific)|tara:strand:+ start:1112 stop:1741 length:630 start_codon:yes stop_codon:yes gene_type:complete
MNITNEDNMELMARYEDNYFDLAIVDPPYGIDLANMNMGAGNKPKHCNKKRRGFKAKDWDIKTPPKEYFKELKRVSKNQIIWGGNYFELGVCYGFCIWDKGSPEGMSFSDCEFAWHSFKKVAKLYKYSTYKNKAKIHPTQKPIKLYEWLLMNYAKEGDKILDTHLGSGSIAIACHNLGYDLTACELDTEYYNAAMKRLKQHTQQLRITI